MIDILGIKTKKKIKSKITTAKRKAPNASEPKWYLNTLYKEVNIGAFGPEIKLNKMVKLKIKFLPSFLSLKYQIPTVDAKMN